MSGLVAVFVSALAFIVSLAIPLATRRWRSFAVVVVLAAIFFAWLDADIGHASATAPSAVGPFIGGLMLVGFAAGAVARFVMLLSRPRAQ